MSRKYFAAPAAVFAMGTSLALGFVTMPTVPAAHADPIPTIDLTDVADALPVCEVEDCSDQPGQVGMWLDSDTGNWYLELGESVTYLVIDNTVTEGGAR